MSTATDPMSTQGQTDLTAALGTDPRDEGGRYEVG